MHQRVGPGFRLRRVPSLGRADLALTLEAFRGVRVAWPAGRRAPPAATRIGLGLSARHTGNANAAGWSGLRPTRKPLAAGLIHAPTNVDPAGLERTAFAEALALRRHGRSAPAARA